MSRTRFTIGVLVVLACLAVFPAAVCAQSGMAGVVKDNTGGVLPGVSVEASSPALIEKSRSAVTDNEGRYQILELRPGDYIVTFTLPGFNTVKREGIELPANFTATVNAEMVVGAIEETVTVTGAAPVVDVKNALVQNVMNRELLDAIPTGRSYQAVAQIAPAVRMDRPDIAGSEAFFSTFIFVHGSLIRDQAMQIDGLDATSGESDGRFTGYYRDDGDNEAVVYTTSAIPAEVSKGGVRVNMIGREGGNQFKGTLFVANAPGGLQSTNLTPELKQRGLPTSREVRQIFDYNFTLGGPIRQDKAWFFSSWRWWGIKNWAAGAFRPDGSRSPDDAEHITGSIRVTTQLTQRNKFMIYFSRMFRRTLYQRGIGPNVPEEASRRHTTPIIFQGNTRWTTTLSSRWLLENGVSTTYTHPKIWPQPSVAHDPNVIPKQDLVLGTFSGAASSRSDLYKGTIYYAGAASFVTGSHAFKAGLQARYVRSRNTSTTTGDKDLSQEYRNGVPSSVTVFATPADRSVHLQPDLGVFAQDQWTINRLTLNYGVRYEYFYGIIDARDVRAGRFVPARHYDEIRGVPNWKDWTPRLGAVWDVFGDGKTALKGSLSKYMWGESVGFSEEYAPSQVGGVNGSDRRTWADRNGDGIAQDSEIGPPNNRNFGLATALRPDPNIKRPYHIEYNVSLQREVRPGMSFTAAYFRRGYHRLHKRVNVALTDSDYTPITVSSPLNGEPITIYNLNPAKRGVLDLVDTNSDANTRKYQGFDVSLDTRLGANTTLFGGITAGKPVDVTCDVPDPNLLRFCDQSSYIPYQGVYKLAGTHLFPYGIVASGTFQSYPGNPVIPQATGSRASPEAGLRVDWQVTPAVVPGLTQPLITVALIPPGSKYLDRYNQLDVRLGKRFKVGSRTIDANLDIFNLLNTNVVMRVTETFGRNLDRPLEIPLARLFRFTAIVKF